MTWTVRRDGKVVPQRGTLTFPQAKQIGRRLWRQDPEATWTVVDPRGKVAITFGQVLNDPADIHDACQIGFRRRRYEER
jgi:hypothetical protein